MSVCFLPDHTDINSQERHKTIRSNFISPIPYGRILTVPAVPSTDVGTPQTLSAPSTPMSSSEIGSILAAAAAVSSPVLPQRLDEGAPLSRSRLKITSPSPSNSGLLYNIQQMRSKLGTELNKPFRDLTRSTRP